MQISVISILRTYFSKLKQLSMDVNSIQENLLYTEKSTRKNVCLLEDRKGLRFFPFLCSSECLIVLQPLAYPYSD